MQQPVSQERLAVLKVVKREEIAPHARAIQAAFLIEWMGGQYAACNPIFHEAIKALRNLGLTDDEIVKL